MGGSGPPTFDKNENIIKINKKVGIIKIGDSNPCRFPEYKALHYNQ